MEKKAKNQEQLFNRILINLGIAILAYILLFIIYAKFYLSPALPIAFIFIGLAIVGYVLTAMKICRLKNYSHMFLGFSACLFFTRLSVVTATLLGTDRFMKLINSSSFFEKLVNSKNDVYFVALLGIIYLVGMLVYNISLINKAGKKKK